MCMLVISEISFFVTEQGLLLPGPWRWLHPCLSDCTSEPRWWIPLWLLAGEKMGWGSPGLEEAGWELQCEYIGALIYQARSRLEVWDLLTGTAASSNSLKSSFRGALTVCFSAICSASSLDCGEKKIWSLKAVEGVTFQPDLLLLWRVSNAAQIHLDGQVTITVSENRRWPYCETKAAGRVTCVWDVGPAHFFGLSLRRGSNLRYNDCFLSADSLNCGQKERKFFF